MSRDIASLTPTNTFQDWYDKTNDVAEALGITVTIGDSETNSGNVIISGTTSSSDGIKTDLLQAFSPANTFSIDVGTITLEGDVYFGSAFNITRDVADTSITLARGDKTFTINTATSEITAENLLIDNGILPADLSANTFTSTYGKISLNAFPIDANDYDTTGDVQYGDATTDTHTFVGGVAVENSDGSRGSTDSNLVGNVSGNVRGQVLAVDNTPVIANGSDGTNATAKASVIAHDNSVIIQNASTRANSSIVTGTIQGSTITATTNFSGSLQGNVTGDLTGKVKNTQGVTVLNNGSNSTPALYTGNMTGDVTGDIFGDVKATNGSIILDSGNGTTIPAEYVGNTIGNVTGDLTGNVTGNVTGNLLGNTDGIHYGDVYRQNLDSDYDIIIDVSARTFIGNISGETTGTILQNEEGGRAWFKGDVRDTDDNVVLSSGTGGNATFSGDADGDHTGSFTGDVTIPEGSTLRLDGEIDPVSKFHPVPKGGIIMWSGAVSSIPTGWGLCDGTVYTYSGVSTQSPNLTDRFIVGAGNDYDVGDTGGANSVTLTTSQMPSHSHSSGSLATNTAGEHIHQIYANNRGSYGSQLDGLGAFRDDAERLLEDWADTIRPAGSHSHTISGSTGSSGSGGAHENRPPYYALAFIIRL